MRRLEQLTVEAGSTWNDLMERAGSGVARIAAQKLDEPRGKQVLILVGPGNNGGDGLVVARHVHHMGAHVSLYIWQRQGFERDLNWQQSRARKIAEYQAAEDSEYQVLKTALGHTDMVVDALLGMGVNRETSGSLADILNLINQARAARPFKVLAIDLPTGINSDTGQVLGTALRADVTVATGAVKRGLLFYPAHDYAGTLLVTPINIPHHIFETIMSEKLTPEIVRPLLPERPAASHKGTFGKVLVVAGSLNYPGAAALATSAAYRAGAGLVTLASARSIIGISGRAPEVTLLPLAETNGVIAAAAADELHKQLENYQALLIGPGLGQEEPTQDFMQRLLGLQTPRQRPRVGFRPPTPEEEHAQQGFTIADLPPTVIDADGLNMLAKLEHWAETVPRERLVLTPHPGEMQRLLNGAELAADLVQATTEAAQQWGQVVVLKGATTVIAAPDGRSLVYPGGNAALATAGTGDVLAGVIAALLAQGVALFDAAALGVYLHAASGALLRDELGDMGTLAGDLLPRLPLVIRALKMGQ
ncbi:MAG: NAD(P)H-hydrate dehydratase [Chloroflexaceae bacterium]|nr:NAD(P)H-hydrate dehydratase [Chloroflexaceae bacterium]